MENTKVLYNAECPVCNFEIKHYAKYSDVQGLPVSFEDLNESDMSRWSLTKDQAMRRLYVLHEGKLLSGMPAFIVLWREMPRYQWLARVTSWPIMRPVTVFLYDWLLAPAIYRWALWRNRNK